MQLGGLPWCCPGTRCRQLPPACTHGRSALPAECYRACGRCTGPEDSSCLRCKRGWMLHEHRCIGEYHGRMGGQQASLGLRGAVTREPGLSGAMTALSQTSTSAARRWRTAEPTSSASTRRAPTSAEVRWRWGVVPCRRLPPARNHPPWPGLPLAGLGGGSGGNPGSSSHGRLLHSLHRLHGSRAGSLQEMQQGLLARWSQVPG